MKIIIEERDPVGVVVNSFETETSDLNIIDGYNVASRSRFTIRTENEILAHFKILEDVKTKEVGIVISSIKTIKVIEC